MNPGRSNSIPPGKARTLRSGFTLIELILVMTILTIAVSITAPALANFFRGRTLDSEARRFLSLTRQGQSRAVAEGMPMELWIDSKQNTFGLEAQPGYDPTDPKAVDFTIDNDIQIDVVSTGSGSGVNAGSRTGTLGNSSPNGSVSAKPVLSNHPDLPKLRFLPDGTLDDSSPKAVRFTGRDGTSLSVVQGRNRTSYEIRMRAD